MRRFCENVGLFIAPLIILLALFEWAFRATPNLYSDKVDMAFANENAIDVLVLGNSHAYYGIDPAVLGPSALNLAGPSQTLRYDDFIFDRVSSSRRVRNVVLNISAFSFGFELHDSVEQSRCRFYEKFWSYPEPHAEPGLFVMSIGLDTAARSMWSWWVRGETPVTHGQAGMARNPSGDVHDIEVSAQMAASRHTQLYVKDREPVLIDFLRSLVTRTRQRGAQLLLVQLPTTPLYHELMENFHGTQTAVRVAQELAAEEHVSLLNLRDLPGLDLSHFHDGDHLSVRGAAIASRAIADALSNSNPGTLSPRHNPRN